MIKTFGSTTRLTGVDYRNSSYFSSSFLIKESSMEFSDSTFLNLMPNLSVFRNTVKTYPFFIFVFPDSSANLEGVTFNNVGETVLGFVAANVTLTNV